MHGKLFLVPTPIDDVSELHPVTFKGLHTAYQSQKAIFVIEDLKPGRKRWLRFGLPREAIESFHCLNEHSSKDAIEDLLRHLKEGKDVYLMSDGGLPCFCDPGQKFVRKCHELEILVTSLGPSCNSLALAVALSGFDSHGFHFYGFLNKDGQARNGQFLEMMSRKETSVFMDTPYRLNKVLRELKDCWKGDKKLFIAADLGENFQILAFGNPVDVLSKLGEGKREFVGLIGD